MNGWGGLCSQLGSVYYKNVLCTCADPISLPTVVDRPRVCSLSNNSINLLNYIICDCPRIISVFTSVWGLHVVFVVEHVFYTVYVHVHAASEKLA